MNLFDDRLHKHCICDRGNIAVFFCNVETCKDNEQKLFCTDCAMFDNKHLHEKVQIMKELEKKINQW